MAVQMMMGIKFTQKSIELLKSRLYKIVIQKAEMHRICKHNITIKLFRWNFDIVRVLYRWLVFI